MRIDQLGDDVLKAILIETSIEDLSEMRCVSKKWNKLITDPKFMKLMLKKFDSPYFNKIGEWANVDWKYIGTRYLNLNIQSLTNRVKKLEESTKKQEGIRRLTNFAKDHENIFSHAAFQIWWFYSIGKWAKLF